MDLQKIFRNLKKLKYKKSKKRKYLKIINKVELVDGKRENIY